MIIIFDKNKDAINQRKHGVSMALAASIDWSLLLSAEDIRHNYGEVRIIGYAPIGPRIYCVVFTDREHERHIISLRKANSREVNHYVSKIE
jgi:uncharacterized DUF497 family protein